jgi:hypothetical protein
MDNCINRYWYYVYNRTEFSDTIKCVYLLKRRLPVVLTPFRIFEGFWYHCILLLLLLLYFIIIIIYLKKGITMVLQMNPEDISTAIPSGSSSIPGSHLVSEIPATY